MGAVELAQERLRLADQRGPAQHASTGTATVHSADVASSPLQVDAAQPEVPVSEAGLQRLPPVSEWRHLSQPHALERRPKVQRRLQQAASGRPHSLPSVTNATPQRQMVADVALQRHRTEALGSLDSYPALAALASFLEKGRSVCWELELTCVS